MDRSTKIAYRRPYCVFKFTVLTFLDKILIYVQTTTISTIGNKTYLLMTCYLKFSKQCNFVNITS